MLRDSRTMTIVLVMPLVLLLLFGFAISTEVNDIRVVASVQQHNDETRAVLSRLQSNSYITFKGIVAHDRIESVLRKGEADAAVVMNNGDGAPEIQIIIDASNTYMAQTSAIYIESIVGDGNASSLINRTLYNPQLKSSYNFVPGIMGMIFILICAIMTSVSIVHEKETGSMDLLLISPVRPRAIILGKMIPYFILSCIVLSLMLIISFSVLGLPFSANVFNVICLSLLYIVLSLAIGLLVSSLASTQVAALLVSGVLFMLPVIMLSGMIFPIDNMPEVLQWISCIIPARWYISAMRTLMIQQLPLSYAATEVIVLTIMTIAILILSIRLFNTRH